MIRDVYEVMAITARLWRAGRLAGPPPSCARPTRPRAFALTARAPQPDFETELREVFRQREQETLAGGHRVKAPVVPPPPPPEPVDARIVRLQRELKSAKTQLRSLREDKEALRRQVAQWHAQDRKAYASVFHDQAQLQRLRTRVAEERAVLRRTISRIRTDPTSAFLLGVAYGLRWLMSEPHWPAPHRMGLEDQAGEWHLMGPAKEMERLGDA